jgi:hypothetical protein
MRLEQIDTPYWALIVSGVVVADNVPAGTVGFAYANPMADLYGFFGESQRALAEWIAKEDGGLIVWLS